MIQVRYIYRYFMRKQVKEMVTEIATALSVGRIKCAEALGFRCRYCGMYHNIQTWYDH